MMKFKKGDFSKLTRISVLILKYHGEIGAIMHRKDTKWTNLIV